MAHEQDPREWSGMVRLLNGIGFFGLHDVDCSSIRSNNVKFLIEFLVHVAKRNEFNTRLGVDAKQPLRERYERLLVHLVSQKPKVAAGACKSFQEWLIGNTVNTKFLSFVNFHAVHPYSGFAHFVMLLLCKNDSFKHAFIATYFEIPLLNAMLKYAENPSFDDFNRILAALLEEPSFDPNKSMDTWYNDHKKASFFKSTCSWFVGPGINIAQEVKDDHNEEKETETALRVAQWSIDTHIRKLKYLGVQEPDDKPMPILPTIKAQASVLDDKNEFKTLLVMTLHLLLNFDRPGVQNLLSQYLESFKLLVKSPHRVPLVNNDSTELRQIDVQALHTSLRFLQAYELVGEKQTIDWMNLAVEYLAP